MGKYKVGTRNPKAKHRRREAPEGKRKSLPFFSPDHITTVISQALLRDLANPKQVYGGTSSVPPERAAAMEMQSAQLLKKYEAESLDSEALAEQAFAGFRAINTYLGRLSKSAFPYGVLRDSRRLPYYQRAHLKAKALMHSILGDITEDEWFSKCRHGTGSTVGVPFRDTSITAKMRTPITITVNAEIYFKRYLEWDFQFHNTLDTSEGLTLFRYVVGSRATTVSKDSFSRRMIAPEPTGNMFLQQGMMEVMYDRLRAIGLDVESVPEKHRLFAKLSSITRRQATIDWSKASDSVWTELVRWLLPPKWFGILDGIRCRMMQVGGEWVELKLFSSMGNACTFPLETLIFWVYAQACASLDRGEHTLHIDPMAEPRISVFGDDCILPTEHAERFVTVLEGAGFTCNLEKSHYREDDAFRESCGGDYLRGYNVRPYFLKAPTGTRKSDLAPWLFIIFNSLQRKYIQYFGELSYVYDREVFKVILRCLAEAKIPIPLVPPHFPDDSGIQDLDGLRLALAYDIRYDSIRKNNAGWIVFRFHKYRYKERCETSHPALLWKYLKFPLHKSYLGRLFGEERTEDVDWYATKKGGGYVVAKGLSTTWDPLVPDDDLSLKAQQ